MSGAPDTAPARPVPELCGWILILATLPIIGLARINPPDICWHLATARLAEATGHWPVRNTFSWTHPDHPLYQQYPVFQGIVHGAFRAGGWEALSLLLFAGWSGVFLLFVRAAGPLRQAVPFHLFWALVAFSLQTRTALRPDLLSLSLLALMLIVFDAYRRRRAVIALVPLLHWLWVNGHQFFVLSFALQGLFVGHLVLARRGWLGAEREAPVPIWPVLAAGVGSFAVSFLSPLGAGWLRVFAQTQGSLAHHRADVQELARVWSDPVWLGLALAVILPTGLVLLRAWRRWSPLDVGLWLLGVALAVTAIRGLVYGTLLSGLVFQRTLVRQPITWRPSPFLRRYFRGLALAGTAALAFAALQHRWLSPSDGLAGHQAGLGRSQGDWPDAALEALRADPPPGRMMNLPWSAANAVIWQWPEQPVFVDPRFEAYPRAFLVDALRSRHDDGVLARLIDTHQPSWLYVEHCTSYERERVARLVRSGRWQVTYADVLALALVARTPATEEYRARHPFDPNTEPRGLLEPEERRARQRLCWARLLLALDQPAAAREQLARAASEAAGVPELRLEIARAQEGMGIIAQ